MRRRRRHDHPKPPPKRIASILARLRAGERLCRSFRPRAVGEPDDVTIWWLEPSGAQCGPASARWLTATAAVAPCDPGLFGTTDAQSWRYVS